MIKRNRTKVEQDCNRLIGQEIRTLRLKHKMSRIRVAESVGVTHQQIMKYEKGIDNICVSRLFLIAKKLKTNINHFYQFYQKELDECDSTLPILQDSNVDKCAEIMQNFMKISNCQHKKAVHLFVKSLSKVQ